MRIGVWHIVVLIGICFGFCQMSVVCLAVPAHFPEPVYDFSKNSLTDAKVQLGRALFYDPVLSKDGTISCASCHSPYNAFAHTDHDLSHGINDQIGTRNAPPLFNLAWQTSFNWDGAINHLDMQALAPITDEREMGESFDKVIGKLKDKPLYQKLFAEAFDNQLISGANTLKALSAFQLTLISSNSKYDQVITQKDTFNQQETQGLALFQTHCNSCHTAPLFSNYDFENNGLPIDTTLNDFGKGMITNLENDSLLFKVPTLRNLSYTYPYMHDGRFDKLGQVLKHYTTRHDNPIKLSSNERVDLIAFLLTLNDKAFVFDKKHQYPRFLNE